MSRKEGAAARAHIEELVSRTNAERAKRLDEARDKAKASGKELFDARELSKVMDTRSRIGRKEKAEVIAELEAEYYLAFPDVKTMREYAELREALDAKSPG